MRGSESHPFSSSLSLSLSQSLILFLLPCGRSQTIFDEPLALEQLGPALQEDTSKLAVSGSFPLGDWDQEDALLRGLRDTVWPGRSQYIPLTESGSVSLFVDGAHTDDSLVLARQWFEGKVAAQPQGGEERRLRSCVSSFCSCLAASSVWWGALMHAAPQLQRAPLQLLQ